MRRGVAVAIVIPTMLVSGCAGGSSNAVPYTDADAHGRITFYNAAGQVITSGLVDSRPFATKATQDVAAPSLVGGPGRKATLYMAQPREGVDPTEWNTYKMTPSSDYSDPRSPTAVFGSAETSLADALSFYPATWHGFVEMRMYLSAPLQSVQDRSYAATNLEISGDRWRQLSPTGEAGS